MTDYSTLTVMKRGVLASVIIINADKKTKQRLEDLGIVPDTKILCVMKSPLGDPIAYLFRGALIALRSEDSKKILVTFCTNGENEYGTDT